MTKNYRVLNLTKKQIKDFFKKKAIDFATDDEKFEFNYFNITNKFILYNTEFRYYDFENTFENLEEGEDFIKNLTNKNHFTIIQKIVLIMNN